MEAVVESFELLFRINAESDCFFAKHTYHERHDRSQHNRGALQSRYGPFADRREILDTKNHICYATVVIFNNANRFINDPRRREPGIPVVRRRFSMPPKQRFSREDVVDAAFAVVRREGWPGLSARAIAKELNSSTRPIYDHLESMKHIEDEVVKKALACFVDFISRDRTGDKWLDQALGYVMFADREKHLFRCINDEKHIPAQKKFAREHWDRLGDQLSGDPRFKGLSREEKNRVRVARWFMLHGLSFLISNGWFSLPEGEKSVLVERLGLSLVDFLRMANQALYDGFIKAIEDDDPEDSA